jgi:hypothetical protein
MSWIDDNKGQTPWSVEIDNEKLSYNDGSVISTSDNPIWSMDHSGVAISNTHKPCGYWNYARIRECNKRECNKWEIVGVLPATEEDYYLTDIISMVEYKSKIYLSAGDLKQLYEWDGDSIALKAYFPFDSRDYQIESLFTHEGRLYGISNSMNLYIWDGSSAWDLVSLGHPYSTTYNAIRCTGISYAGNIYGGPNYKGNLQRVGESEWEDVTPAEFFFNRYVASDSIIHNDKIYTICRELGGLYYWNGTDDWVFVNNDIALEYTNAATTLAILSNELYTIDDNGYLFKLVGSSWVQQTTGALLSGGATYRHLLTEHDGGLYYTWNSSLLKWDGYHGWSTIIPLSTYVDNLWIGSVKALLNSSIGDYETLYAATTSGYLLRWKKFEYY